MKADVTLFHEGDEGNMFYIVKEGTLSFTMKGQVISKFKEGNTFGEMALMEKTVRTGNVKTLSIVQLYCIDGENFRKVINKLNNRNMKDRMYFLSLIPIFSKWLFMVTV